MTMRPSTVRQRPVPVPDDYDCGACAGAGLDEDCECDSVCTNCEHVPVTEWSCVECDGSIHGEVEKWAFCRGKNQQTCDACLEKPVPVPVPVPAVPVCFNCDEHFTGDQTSDDFLNWEYCEGRKQWACNGDCRDKWDEPCVDDTCAYCGNAPCDDDACVCCDKHCDNCGAGLEGKGRITEDDEALLLCYSCFEEHDEEEQYCPCGWALTDDDLALESGKCEGCTLKDAAK